MRVLFWEDLPAPKEEEPPKIDPQGTLFEKELSADDTDDTDEENEEEGADDE